MEIIGQDSILSSLKDTIYNINSNVFLFSGPVGSGKHSVVTFLASLVGYEIKDITDVISYDYIMDMYLDVFPKVYVINLDDLALNSQNELLKLLEEPPIKNYICVLTSSLGGVLETIVNRCSVFEMLPYSKETLSKFMKKNNSAVLDYCSTPGDVIRFECFDIDSINAFCNKIFDKIGNAPHANILKISDSLAWKDEQELFNVDLFFRVLFLVSYKRYISTMTDECYVSFVITDQLMKDLSIPRINRRQLFETYLFDLRSEYDRIREIKE